MENKNTNTSADMREKYKRQTPSRQYSGKNSDGDKKTAPDEKTPEMIRAEKRKAAQKQMIRNNLKNVAAILAVVVSVAVMIALVVVSCVNDVLAVHISEADKKSATVEIREGMDTGDVIDVLDDAGVIRNAWFCKLAAKFFGYTDDGYIARTYEFNRSMGLENMLNEIKNNKSSTAKTVTLTFPEGYSAEQIINLLAQNYVCSREKFMEALYTVDFASEFDFLGTINNSGQRYNYLEGYLFPDTYEFYLGESAESVIRKFLNNFNNKWTENYDEKAEQLGMSVDEVVRLASVIEKEAIGSDMPVVASILLNRLDAGMRLECDSTSSYIRSNTSGLTEFEINAYNTLYDTYVCGALPVGSICNPGLDAIDAVLNPSDTSCYYFIHDSNNVLRIARTLSEHENNVAVYGLAS